MFEGRVQMLGEGVWVRGVCVWREPVWYAWAGSKRFITIDLHVTRPYNQTYWLPIFRKICIANPPPLPPIYPIPTPPTPKPPTPSRHKLRDKWLNPGYITPCIVYEHTGRGCLDPWVQCLKYSKNNVSRISDPRNVIFDCGRPFGLYVQQ